MTGNIIAIILAYLIGAIPIGFVLGKTLKGIDIREYGSGRIGASNVLRSLGVKATVFVFVFDIGKGVVAVFIAKGLGGPAYVEMLAGMAAVVGHNWSVFLRFSGGRGVNTGLGGLFAMVPVWASGALGAGLLVIGLSRYVSLGSMCGSLFGAIATLGLALTGNAPWEYFYYAVVVFVLIIFQHKDNLERLYKRQERRLGEKATPRGDGGISGETGQLS